MWKFKRVCLLCTYWSIRPGLCRYLRHLPQHAIGQVPIYLNTIAVGGGLRQTMYAVRVGMTADFTMHDRGHPHRL